MRTRHDATLRRVAALAWIGPGVLFFVVEALAASRIPGYDYARDYVSVLGDARLSPLAWWMNATFRMQGLLFVVAGALTLRGHRPRRHRLAFIACSCVYGAGSVLVGLAPLGGPLPGALHVAGATGAIVGGNAAILVAAFVDRFTLVARRAAACLGPIGVVSLTVLVSTDLPAGACERGAIYSILGWQLIAGSSTGWAARHG